MHEPMLLARHQPPPHASSCHQGLRHQIFECNCEKKTCSAPAASHHSCTSSKVRFFSISLPSASQMPGLSANDSGNAGTSSAAQSTAAAAAAADAAGRVDLALTCSRHRFSEVGGCVCLKQKKSACRTAQLAHAGVQNRVQVSLNCQESSPESLTCCCLCAIACWLHVRLLPHGLLPLPPQHCCKAWQHCCVMLQAIADQTVNCKAYSLYASAFQQIDFDAELNTCCWCSNWAVGGACNCRLTRQQRRT